MTEILENILNTLNSQEYVDILLYLFIFYFIYFGWKNGSIMIVFYISALLLAIFSSFRYSSDVGSYISSWLNSNLELSEVFGGILIFVAILTLASFLLNLLSNRVKKADLGSKALGASISLLVSNLILTLIFTATNMINLPNYFQNSVSESNLVNFYVSP